MEGPADQQAPIDQNNPDNPGGQNNRGQKPGDLLVPHHAVTDLWGGFGVGLKV